MKEPLEPYRIYSEDPSRVQRSIRITYPPNCDPLQAPEKHQELDELMEKIQILEAENKHLLETIGWMHDTIWKLLRKNVINS